MSDSKIDDKVIAPKTEAAPNTAKPEDVPDDQLEAVAGGWGHDRWYHHHEGRRGYYRNGAFINLNL
jgi:hypothetical protein